MQNKHKPKVAKNFPRLGREMDIYIHDAQNISNKLNSNKNTRRHSQYIVKNQRQENFKSRKIKESG